MAFTVYALCALTSLACSVLLLRGFLRSRARLLLWSGLCFAGLFINNALLTIDTRVPYDLSITRSIPAVIGVLLLMYGLIWESDR
ncbi:MAG TPA: DUF5985 family protein [Gemmatimonadaceae bacterium]|nr:DUF5985 family protein [Gemmatimonadaceae bacterium]